MAANPVMKTIQIILLLMTTAVGIRGQGIFSLLGSLNPFSVTEGFGRGTAVAPPLMVMDQPTVDMGVYNPLAYGNGIVGRGFPFGMSGGIGMFPMGNAGGLTGFPTGGAGFGGGLPEGFSMVQQGNGPPLYVQQLGAPLGDQGEGPSQQFGNTFRNTGGSSWDNQQFWLNQAFNGNNQNNRNG